jgi:hypothetical protein
MLFSLTGSPTLSTASLSTQKSCLPQCYLQCSASSHRMRLRYVSLNYPRDAVTCHFVKTEAHVPNKHMLLLLTCHGPQDRPDTRYSTLCPAASKPWLLWRCHWQYRTSSHAL